MATEKLISILLSRTDLTRDELEGLDESEGWKLVYELDKRKGKAKSPEICFTGFSRSDRQRLADIATTAGFIVKDVVTQKLALLVAGENAGPSKIKKAESQNCPITNEAGFIEYTQTINEKLETRSVGVNGLDA